MFVRTHNEHIQNKQCFVKTDFQRFIDGVDNNRIEVYVTVSSSPRPASIMLRVLIRFLGLLFLAGGFVSLIVDGTRSLSGGRLFVTTLHKGAADMFPLALKSLQATVESNIGFFLWDPILTTLLLTPVGVVFGGLGALLMVISHKQQAPIVYSNR